VSSISSVRIYFVPDVRTCCPRSTVNGGLGAAFD
jgi:hypothetical protein